MAVKITAKFKMPIIEKKIKDHIKKIDKAVLDRLIKAGKIFVNNARKNGGYQNQTHNLVSSIAFVILKNGEKVYEDFKQIGPGSEGVDTAKNIIESKISKFKRGYALICVAGMDYAAYVESGGRDVITGSSIMVKNDLSAAFKKV